MKQHLSIREHLEVAKELQNMLDTLKRIYGIINGKVPLGVVDQVVSFGRIDRALGNLRSNLANELVKRHGRDEVYYL